MNYLAYGDSTYESYLTSTNLIYTHTYGSGVFTALLHLVNGKDQKNPTLSGSCSVTITSLGCADVDGDGYSTCANDCNDNNNTIYS